MAAVAMENRLCSGNGEQVMQWIGGVQLPKPKLRWSAEESAVGIVQAADGGAAAGADTAEVAGAVEELHCPSPLPHLVQHCIYAHQLSPCRIHVAGEAAIQRQTN